METLAVLVKRRLHQGFYGPEKVQNVKKERREGKEEREDGKKIMQPFVFFFGNLVFEQQKTIRSALSKRPDLRESVFKILVKL